MTSPAPHPSGVFPLPAPCWKLVLENGEGPFFEGEYPHYLTEAEGVDELRQLREDKPDDQRTILLEQEPFTCWEGYARCGTLYIYEGDMETWHFPSRHDVEYTMASYNWTAGPDGTWLCDNEKCAACHPNVDPLDVPVTQVDGQLQLTWTDPVTGLTSGPLVEVSYPLRCQHCENDIRQMPGGDFYEDVSGFTTCRKDLGHHPMPVVS